MIFSDLASPAEAENEDASRLHGLRAGGKPVSTFWDHALAPSLAPARKRQKPQHSSHLAESAGLCRRSQAPAGNRA